jgi:Flp pilus assembly pilin Flp
MSRIPVRLTAKLRRLIQNEWGQDLLEYGLLVAMIALVSISGVQGAANGVNDIFGQVSQAFDSTGPQPAGTPPPPPPPPPHRHHGGGGGHGWWH